MKLLRVKLVGYKGIYNGMGFTELEIDFSKSINKVIMIKGDNGSGKSTLFNALHMFPDGNYNLIDDMECRKELLYTCDGALYDIKIIHGYNKKGRTPTKAYIHKLFNGNKINLNPNGNITSYIQTIEDEFLLEPNFLALSQLSVEDRGLVDMKPSERKKFIGSILKEVEGFNQINKIISNKASVFKNQINSIVSKLKYLEGETNLSEHMSYLDFKLNSTQEEKIEIIKSLERAKSKVDNLDGCNITNQIDEIVDQLRTKDIDLNVNMTNLNSLLLQINKTTNKSIDLTQALLFADKINDIISDLEVKRTELNTLVEKKMMNKELILSKIQDKLIRLDSIKKGFDEEKFLNDLEVITSTIKSLEPNIRQMGIRDINNISTDEYINALEVLNKVKDIVNVLTTQFSPDVIEETINNLNSLPDVSRLRLNLDNLNREFGKNVKILDGLLNELKKVDILKDRPGKCKIDSCKFIAEAVNVNTHQIEGKIDEKSKEQDSLYIQIKNLEKEIEHITTLYDCRNMITEYLSILRPSVSILRKLNVKTELQYIDTAMDLLLYKYDFTEEDTLYQYIDNANMIDIYKDSLIKYDKFKIYEENYNKMKVLISDIETDLNTLNIDSNNIINEIETSRIEIENIDKDLSVLKNVEPLLSSFKSLSNDREEMITNHSELKETYDNLIKSNTELCELNDKIHDFNTNLSKLTKQIDMVEQERYDIMHKIRTAEEYKNELSTLQDEFDDIDTIKKSTSMSTGIQTVFMSVYMNKILEVANNLLSHLFNGEFELGNFVINSKEFRIPCYGSGLTNDDISSMSTSQKCMISLVLSFTLLCQSSIKYNILKLDEMDGGLDNTNRGIFVETLYRLIDLLKSDQVFIISHNNEMNLDECDLIVLRSSDTYHSGNIIYDFNK